MTSRSVSLTQNGTSLLFAFVPDAPSRLVPTAISHLFGQKGGTNIKIPGGHCSPFLKLPCTISLRQPFISRSFGPFLGILAREAITHGGDPSKCPRKPLMDFISESIQPLVIIYRRSLIPPMGWPFHSMFGIHLLPIPTLILMKINAQVKEPMQVFQIPMEMANLGIKSQLSPGVPTWPPTIAKEVSCLKFY